nr:hypothetical protein [Micromonospora sp. WMMC415]
MGVAANDFLSRVRFWAGFDLRKVGDGGIGLAEVDLGGRVERDALVRADVVELGPVRLGDGVERRPVGDLLVVEPFVLQWPERLFAYAVGVWCLLAGADVGQLGSGGDEPGERGRRERRPVVGGQPDRHRLAVLVVGSAVCSAQPSSGFGHGDRRCA